MSAAMAIDRPRIDAEAVKTAVAARGGLQRLAEDLGLDVKGRTLRCPNAEAHAHGDKRPSASIGADSWRCHACGAGGDALELLRVARALTFPEALAELADLVGLEPDLSRAGKHARTMRPAPRLVEAPKAPAVPDGAAELLRAVWRLVAPMPLTSEAEAYLRGRAIEPWAVHETGARDWWPVRHELRELLRGASSEVKRAAGFYGEPEDGRPKPWWPVAALVTDDARGRGLFVPVFLPGDSETPAGWRWRTVDRGARIKALSMPGATPLPYGLELPTSARFHGARTGLLRPAVGHELVVVAEGEPDWWTLAGALGPDAGLVTLTAKSAGWPAWATPHLDRAEAVVVVTHAPKPKAEGAAAPADTVVDSLFVALASRRGAESTRRALRVLRQDETADWNDLAQSGRLSERLEKLRPMLDATMTGVLRRIEERERAA